MPERRRSSDDARPIPTRREPVRPDSGVEDDDVYTVDTRGRRRAPRPRPQQSTARREPPGARRRATPERLPTEPAGPGQGPRPERRRRRPWARLLAVLIVGWLAFLVATPIHAWQSVSRVDDTPVGSRPAETNGSTYLLVGSDSREGMTAQEKKDLGTGAAEGRRTDSIMLVHVPAGGGKSVILSIPRDSYVPIPGHNSNKINAAYAVGGPRLLVQTVERTTDLRIDGYLEIGFGGFASVVNSLGGVDLCVPFDMDDPKAHINLKKGCQTLDGKNALGFVRARYSDPRGDIGRAERQRQFLGAIMKGAATPATVLHPFRYWSFTHSSAEAVRVGEDTSMRDAIRILQAMRGASSGSTLGLTVPIERADYPTRAGIAVKWDTERAQALFTSLREDQPLEAPPAGTDGKPSRG